MEGEDEGSVRTRCACGPLGKQRTTAKTRQQVKAGRAGEREGNESEEQGKRRKGGKEPSLPLTSLMSSIVHQHASFVVYRQLFISMHHSSACINHHASIITCRSPIVIG